MAGLKEAILSAAQRIHPYVRRTPLDESLVLSEMGSDRVFLKLENLQYTGSFKLRGATNKLLSLAPEMLAQGVVAASSGNHGAAVAYALRRLGARGIIFVPKHAATTKVEAIQRYGAEVQRWGKDSVEAETHARTFATQSERTYISPYNDREIVAGQGMIGLEIMEDLPDVEALYVTVGGDGLIGGIAGYIKAARQGKPVRIVGCLPAHSPVMYESVRAGHIVQMESLPTLSDGSAGGIEEDAVTFALCQQLVDDWILVTEAEIAGAVRLIAQTHHLMIEGAAGVAVAAYLKDAQRGQNRNVAIVLCGANIDLAVLKTIL